MAKCDSDKVLEKDYQTYLEHRKSCYATKNNNIERQDKIVIAISSAVFGLLLTIFDKSMIEGNQCAETLLIILLFSNGAALFSSLWSFFFANKAIERKMKDMESYLLFQKKSEARNVCECITKVLNFVSLFITCATIVFLAAMIKTIL